MATLQLTITYPDDKQATLVEALRDRYGKNSNGDDYSAAELRDLFEASVRRQLEVIYKKYREKAANLNDLNAT